jgi:hypothetical protein
MVQRFLRDESGITLGLAIMMILLISVMGAGLLTFVSRDLNTVLETNRGQRAFEVADAGIAAAERQIELDCIGDSACRTSYDGGEADIQWSVTEGGVTLNDLDGDGNVTTEDNATVTIEYREFIDATNDFRVISTGTYGDSKRKIEAIFEPIADGGGGGGNVVNPAYYTPSDIKLSADATGGVQLSGMSLFSGRNIIIDGITSANGTEATSLPNEYRSTQSPIDILNIVNSGPKPLEDWDSENFDPPGKWNTIGRVKRPGFPGPSRFEGVGFGAEGLICGSTTNCDPLNPSHSVADGWLGYDSTTGPINGLTGASQTAKGQGLTFIDKQPIDETCGTGPDCYGPNALGTISYPFERKSPDAARLKQLALNTGSWYRGSTPDWDTLFPGGDNKRVVFIDAGDAETPLTFDGGNGTEKGILIVWCGRLNMTNFNPSGFNGIVMTLNGSADGEGLPPDPSGEPSSSCGPEQGSFKIDDAGLKAWFYAEAEGGALDPPGIELGPGTQADFLPAGDWRLLDLLLEDPVPTEFDLQGWRECYQIENATQCNT